MLISGGNNLSQLSVCLEAARHFLLSDKDVREMVEKQQVTIQTHWDSVRDEAKLSPVDKNFLWRRQFLNPFIFQS